MFEFFCLGLFRERPAGPAQSGGCGLAPLDVQEQKQGAAQHTFQPTKEQGARGQEL